MIGNIYLYNGTLYMCTVEGLSIIEAINLHTNKCRFICKEYLTFVCDTKKSIECDNCKYRFECFTS